MLSAALSWVLSPVKHLRTSSLHGLKLWSSYKHDFHPVLQVFLSCFPVPVFCLLWLLLISHSCCGSWFREVPLTTCSSSGLLARFLLLFLHLLTLLFQRCLKEADVEAFTPTALLPLFSPGNTLFSTSLACVERGFYSLGVGHNSEHPPTPSLCSNACFGNMNNKYVLKFIEDTVKELKSKLEV